MGRTPEAIDIPPAAESTPERETHAFLSARIYLIWCISFWFFCIMFVISIPGTAWVLANLVNPTEMKKEGIVRFYESLFTITLNVGILGAPFGGIVAPLAVRSPERRRYWTKASAVLMGLWAIGGLQVPLIWQLPKLLARPQDLTVAIFAMIVASGMTFGVVFGISYFVNRYAVWSTIKVLSLSPSIRRFGLCVVVYGLALYVASYAILRYRGTLSFQERNYVDGGAFSPIYTPDHIRAASRAAEWFY